MFQFGKQTCQTACQCFKRSLYKMLGWNFYTLLLYKKFYFKPISQLCISYVYVSYIKTILYFISILHVILHKSGWSFSFLSFYFYFLLFNEEWNIKGLGFYTLQITKIFSNFPQLKQLKKYRIRVNIVIFLNYDLHELETRDSYKKPSCDYVSFHYLRQRFRVLLFLK